MKGKYSIWSIAFILLALLVVSCSSGSDDDASGDNDTVDDDAVDDDSAADDDIDDDAIDDDSVDDDTVDDDTVDDDVVDDDTVFEYSPVICAIPDVEKIGEDLTVGGGPISGLITVYVYAEEDLDGDGDCDPLPGAYVNGYSTDSNGQAILGATKGVNLVVAKKEGYWSWAYKADAKVMYFRLPRARVGSYADSDSGQFQFDGAPLALQNPQGEYTLANLLDTPFYVGITVPAIIRQALFSTDPTGLMPSAANDFPISYTYQILDGELQENARYLPGNFYLPTMNFETGIPLVLPIVTGEGAHESYVLPVHDNWTTKPVEGLVLSANLGNALDAAAVAQIAQEFVETGNIVGALLTQADALINDALTVQFSGANVSWDGVGAPNIDLVENAAKNTVNVTIANPNPDFDYLLVLAAEIPNRAWWPIGLKLADAGGQATFDVTSIPEARYSLIVGKTDVIDGLSNGDPYVRVSFALKYAATLADWSAGVTLDDADFLPLFDIAQTEYTAEGVINWQLETGDAPDLFTVLVDPVHDNLLDEALAYVPAADSSFDAASVFDFTPNQDGVDVVGVFGVDLPESATPNQFNPLAMMGYDCPRATLWVNYDLSSLLP